MLPRADGNTYAEYEGRNLFLAHEGRDNGHLRRSRGSHCIRHGHLADEPLQYLLVVFGVVETMLGDTNDYAFIYLGVKESATRKEVEFWILELPKLSSRWCP